MATSGEMSSQERRKQLQIQTQKANSLVSTQLSLSYNLPLVLSSALLSPLSDFLGRKFAIFLAAVGVAAKTIMFYSVFFMEQPFYFLYIGNVMAGLGGSMVGVSYAYLSDICTKKNRSSRFILLESCILITAGSSLFLQNLWLDISGQITVWMFVPIFLSLIFAFIFIFFCLEDQSPSSSSSSSSLSSSSALPTTSMVSSLKLSYDDAASLTSAGSVSTRRGQTGSETASNRGANPFLDDADDDDDDAEDVVEDVETVLEKLLNLRSRNPYVQFKRVVLVFFDRSGVSEERSYRLRVGTFLLFLAFLFSVFIQGDSAILSLFLMKFPLCFTPGGLGLFNLFNILLRGFVNIFVQRVVKDSVPDVLLLSASATSGIAAFICLAFSRTEELVFVFLFVGSLRNLMLPVIRSMLSKSVSEMEQGALVGAITIFEIVSELLATSAMGGVYYLLLDTSMPGAVFTIAAAFYIFSLLFVIAYQFVKRRN